jgi:hypothetical protein
VRKENYEYYQSKKLSFQSVIGCKHPIIASGATPIGSAERAPDEENIR